MPGELIGHDIYTDLALIRVVTPYEIAPMKTGDSSLLKQGEFVISIGTPVSMDYQGSLELSMVAANGLQIENSILVEDERYNYFLNVVEISDPLVSGYSGSPLINMNGEAIGMTTMSAQGGVSFAVTINEVKMIAEELLAQNGISRNVFGIKGSFLKDMYNYEKTNLSIPIETVDGLYVERIKENGVAYAAGLRAGDVITKINDEVIIGLDSYLRAIYSDNTQLNIEYVRGGQTLVGSLGND